MNKLYLFFCLFFLQLSAFAQVEVPENEVELNNTFATASPLLNGKRTLAEVSPADPVDFHLVKHLYDGGILIYVKATNNSASGTQYLKLDLYNGLQNTGNVYSGNVSDNENIAAGQTVYDTIRICGKSADSFYLKMETNGAFSYELQWFYYNSASDDSEPNNSLATATVFYQSPYPFYGAIMHEYRGITDVDTADFLQTVIPSSGAVAILIDAWNVSCTNGKWIKYAAFKNNNPVPFASGFVGGATSVDYYDPISTSVLLDGFLPGDVFTVKLTSNAPFSYELTYEDSLDYEDSENNCCPFNAIPLLENESKLGNVGNSTYDSVDDEWDYDDEYDTYKITLPQDGAINLILKSRIETCGMEEHGITLDIYDENQDYRDFIDLRYDYIWDDALIPECNVWRYDTIKIRGFRGETFYLSLSAWGYDGNPKMDYSISYQFLDATTNGDVENNNTAATALPIAAGEVKKGHVAFKGVLLDYYDYYQSTLPATSTVMVYVKARNRTATGTSSNAKISFAIPSINFARSVPSIALKPDSLAIDSFRVCGIPAGNFIFNVSSAEPYEYEISYKVIDTFYASADAEPNNLITTGTMLTPGSQNFGRLRYQGESSDNNDYYKVLLPASGTLQILVEATNISCNNNGALTLRGYDRPNTSTGLKYSKIIADNNTVASGQKIYDTLNVWACNPTSDTFYLQLTANNSFAYKFSYVMLDTLVIDSTKDVEPNNVRSQAMFIGQGQKRTGYTGFVYSGQTDVDDYYKLVASAPGPMMIYFQAQNISCDDNKIFGVWGYNKAGNLLFFKRYVLNAVGTVDAGQMVQDSVPYTIPTGTDSIFIRIEGTGLFKYDVSIKPMVPTSSFTLQGDTTACIGPVYTYKAVDVFNDNVVYNWTLPLGGGTLTSTTDSVATVIWNENANRKIQLTLSNQYGSSKTKQLNIIIDGVAPTQVPVAYNFARRLSTNSLPPGSIAQWYRNDTLISGAVDSAYYAQVKGSYTVRFVNDCGPGPSSNAIVFPADAISQSIALMPLADRPFSASAKVALTASSSSGLPVLYQLVSGNANIFNDTLFISGAGTIIYKALQPGDDIYKPATEVFDTVIISKGNQVITFPTIPTQAYSFGSLTLSAQSSSGLTIDYDVVSGNAAIITTSGGYGTNRIRFTGAGLVTIRAKQSGNASYNAAAPVDQTFCIGVTTLTQISGEATPCLSTYKYTTQKIPGATYNWTLSSGGILTTKNDTAIVQWQTTGTHSLKVTATATCDTIISNEVEYVITTSNNAPAPVTGMLPADGAIDQQLPLKLSWIPGGNTVSYDIYIWDSSTAQPATPYATNITAVSFELPKISLNYNTTYKWRVVAKNPCSQTIGPVQTFRLIPLADLVVSEVNIPSVVNSGQTVTISWKVTNVGPGKTLTTQSWKDAVFFSFDNNPDFRWSPNWNPNSWSSLATPLRPLLLGTKPNVSALDVNQSYTNSVTYTIPPSYSQPLYVYVITDYSTNVPSPLQITRANDTATAAQPINVVLSPTPDLRVDSIFTPTTTFSGSTINLSYKVKNYGVITPIGASWNDSVFISQNPLFDRATALPVNAPLTFGQYYPNANEASVRIQSQLKPDSFYTRNTQVVIPNYIFGTWYIYVKANANTTLYEGSLANNNLNKSQIEVFLTPTPKLQVNQLTVPVTTASTTQPIGINWNVNNAGFYDNWERSKGHRFEDIGTCSYPIECVIQSVGNRVSKAPSTKKQASLANNKDAVSRIPPISRCNAIGTLALDNVTYGSSYWVDRIYISKDSTGLNVANAILVNETKHGTENSGMFVEFLLDEYYEKGNNTWCFPSTGSLSRYNLNVDNVINPGSNFAKSAGFKLPADLTEGNYYVYVHTNATKSVYEYPGTPQITRSILPIAVNRPDVSVPVISSATNATGGRPVTITYNVLNGGNGAVFNHERVDQLYVSNFAVFDATAKLVSSKSYIENVPVGSSVPHSFTYTFPAETSGAKYFYVVTNADSLFKETNYTNNRSLSSQTMLTAATATDLTVSGIQLADTVFTINSNYIKYTVATNVANANGSWTDSLFISCSPTFNAATSFFIAKRVQSRTVPSGSNYSDSFYFNLPKMSFEINSCFPTATINTVYFFVKTNSDTSLYEGSYINNNVLGTTSRKLVNSAVDLTITSVTGDETATVGRDYQIAWKLKNVGYLPAWPYSGGHYSNAVYFSADSLLDNNDVLANSYLSYLYPKRFEEKTEVKNVATPNIQGEYYVIVNTNHTGKDFEIEFQNNINLLRDETGKARKIQVIRPLLPDLVDSITEAPEAIAVGQPITVVHKTTNKGAGVTYPGSYGSRLRLSTDFVAQNNDGDRYLFEKKINKTLLAGASTLDTARGTIPLSTVPGNYVLISEVNVNDAMVESNTSNNLGFKLLNVFTPPPVDLLVEGIVKPDTVILGYNIDTVKWMIKNASPEYANGLSKDGIYLSKNTVLDSTAVLIGIKDKTLKMDPLKTDTVAATPLVDNVVEGNYNIIIKTDLLNNIVEEDKENNTGTSSTPIYVKVKELAMNVAQSATLANTSRYYKLVVPDSLIGSTIMITLKTNDSLTVRNEMFVRSGAIPSPAQFDYRFEIPNYGNQRIVITNVSDPVYYISFNRVSPIALTQNVTIKAEKLPFSILNVQTNSGGNIGNVTVKITGSLFTDSMTATLASGATTIQASAVYFTNSTVVYATFPLQGKPLGLYDLTLTKKDNKTATITDGFSIVPANNGGLITGGRINKGAGNGNEPGCDPGAESGLNSQLVVEMVVPARVLTGRQILIQINYSNPTNFDVPAQSRTLFTEEGMKLSLSREGVATGSKALYFELTEPGGPPGIIRAGGSGTITVFSQAPQRVPADPVVLFKLK